AEDPTLSRKHAVVERTDSGWAVRDLESRNGTFVNGKRVTAHALRHGDQMTVGASRAVFEMVTATSQATIVAAGDRPKLTARERQVPAALCPLLADRASRTVH